MPKTKTTHVSSLPRTQDVATSDNRRTAEVAETICKEAEAGVDIVSDGETSKTSCASHIQDQYADFSGDTPLNAPADLKMLPSFLKRLADGGGTHCGAIPMDTLCTTLKNTKAQDLLFETSNPRHTHEWAVVRDQKSEITNNQVLMPDALDTTTNSFEHPELVAQPIQRFDGIGGAGRVIAGSDCGLSTFAGFGAVAPDIAYAKLKSLSEGAALASDRL